MVSIESTPEMAAKIYETMARNLAVVRRRLGKPLTLAQVADGAEGLVLADLARAIAAKPGAPAISLCVVCRDGPRMAQLSRALSFFGPDLATLEWSHECSFRPCWCPSRACTCISCIGAAPAETLRSQTGPEPRFRSVPAPSIRCRGSHPLLL